MKKIGLFGGTFNPIHFGHLNLAIEIKERRELDEVWFIPAHISPLREEPKIAPHHRLRMAELAVAGIPGFKVLDWEIQRPPPSYTIDTVIEIKSRFPKDSFYLLLGEDCILNFPKWKNPLELVKMTPPLIGCRPPANQLLDQLQVLNFDKALKKSIMQGMVETPLMEISATGVRLRLEKRLYCGHLLPEKVLDYIFQNQLYYIL